MEDTPFRHMLTPVRLDAREIAPPPTISMAAQEFLSWGADNNMQPPAQFGVDDKAAWDQAVAQSNAEWEPLMRDTLARTEARVDDIEIAGVKVFVANPTGERSTRPDYLYCHGGGFVFGSGPFARAGAAVIASKLGTTVYVPDYRTASMAPFPAAPGDCLAVYHALAKRQGVPGPIIGGTSAGGNIAAAVTLMIRDRGLTLPPALILLSPEADLTESGDSFRTNALLDVILKEGLAPSNALYAGGRDLTDTYVSPLYGDFSGFPPTLLQAGTRDLFLSNTVLLHRKMRRAGVDAELHVWEGMPHTGFGGATPEDDEVFAEVGAFMDRHGGR